MDPVWQVMIGTAVATLLLNIYTAYRQYLIESKKSNEKQTMATWSIIVGLSGILFFGITSIIGIILGFISMIGKKHRTLSKIGIFVSILTMLPWIAVIIFGP